MFVFFRTIHRRNVNRLFCTEIWKQFVVPELGYYYSQYLVSNLGKIQNESTGKMLSTNNLMAGTPTITLYNDFGKRKHNYLRIVICSTFHKRIKD